jgi:hypothetical protein
MCGTSPVAHWPRKTDSSSTRARSGRWRARPMLTKEESQLHWCGYSPGEGTVAVPVQFASSTRAAAAHTAVSSPVSRSPINTEYGPNSLPTMPDLPQPGKP